MVESGGLENRCAFAGTVGSNPTLSAISFCKWLNSDCSLMDVGWKGAGVVELAALEML